MMLRHGLSQHSRKCSYLHFCENPAIKGVLGVKVALRPFSLRTNIFELDLNKLSDLRAH